MTDTLWLIVVQGDVSPYLEGPFDDDDERLKFALDYRKSDPEGEDGLYRLDVDEKGIPSVDSFSGGELWLEEWDE